MSTRVRPALESDGPAIDAVQRRNGVGALDSFFWEQNCRHHPYQHLYPHSPPAWVLETAEGEVVGSYINILMPGELEQRPVCAVASGSWCVDLPYRGLPSLWIMDAWFKQPGVDLWLVGTASPVAAPLIARFKTHRIPAADYLDALFWIFDHTTFARSLLVKKGLPAPSLLAPVAGAGLQVYQALTHHPGPPGRFPAQRVTRFDSSFDEFWETLRTQGSRFRVLRSASMLNFRFGPALRQDRLTILTVSAEGRLRGYAILATCHREHLGLRQHCLRDLQALDDDPVVLDSLLAASLAESRAQGMHVLEWQGFHPRKRQIALARRPFHYAYATWPLFFKARDGALQERLLDAAPWDFSTFDAY